MTKRLLSLLLALWLLDAALTFQNVWPTPAILWKGDLSIELTICLAGLAIASLAGVTRWRRMSALLAGGWVVLAIGRYIDVTAPALFGRPINLYWDARHLSNVAAMLAKPASLWIVVMVIIAAIVVPTLVFWVLRWAFVQVTSAMRPHAAERRAVLTTTAALVALLAAQPLTANLEYFPRFTAPVSMTYGRQARLLVSQLTRRGSITPPPSPTLAADLSGLSGADVLLVFVESYGAVTYDRPELESALRPARRQLAADIRESGRNVVSAFVRSSTFGGASWLAHISLLSGIDVRDEDTNNVLMTERRDTLVTTFSTAGYRTIAVMPGLQQDWPEGAFYRFDAIYGERALDYRGPQFGWWALPDQFTLARLDQRELSARRRRPAFVVFPTISTHTPFSPTAPYQPDWARLLTERPYDDADVERAFEAEPDWFDLGPSYVRAIAYDFASFGGYLRWRRERDLVTILIGDHQPPAAVSGAGVRWDVPVHVISSHPELLNRLVAAGFSRGLHPDGRTVTDMHLLGPILLDAFGR